MLTFALHSAGRLLSAAELRPFYLAMAGSAAGHLPDRAGQAARVERATHAGNARGLRSVFAKLDGLLGQGRVPAA